MKLSRRLARFDTGISRRAFLRAGAAFGGGLAVGIVMPGARSGKSAPAGPSDLAGYVRISPGGAIEIYLPVPEIGQRVDTSLPMILAEELEADWSSIRVVEVATEARFGGMAAAGSNSVRDYWDPLRAAGARAREMLIRAAAERWGVAATACSARAGRVHHGATGRTVSYADVAEAAAALPVPEQPALKAAEDFTLIGSPLARPRLDEVVSGRARYGLDVEMPGMAIAVIERAPVPGASVAAFDDTAALAIAGVRKVVRIEPFRVAGGLYGRVEAGVAVLADDTWSAIKGRDALEVDWSIPGDAAAQDSASIDRAFAEALGGEAKVILRNEGDAASVIGGAERVIRADYALPLLAHGTMEPMNFTADMRADGGDLVGPTQHPNFVRVLVAVALGLDRDSVRVRATRAGGGYGRRLAVDYGVEAALVSNAAGGPVKVVWTREDDIRHDYYRAPSAHRLEAAIGADGRVAAWHHRLATASLLEHSRRPGAEPAALYDVQGGADLPLDVANVRFDYTPVTIHTQIGSWRSVSHSSNVFVVASFIDELAHATGRDPLAMNLALLGAGEAREVALPLEGRRALTRTDLSRVRRVLRTAAEKAGWQRTQRGWWGGRARYRRGQGIAWCHYKDSYVAHVAEVEVSRDGGIRVKRIVAAIDVGLVVDPDGLRAQVEGAAMDGVASVLKWRVTLEEGRIAQSNFHDFEMLRISQAPDVEVHIVGGEHPPTGAGEPPYPSVPPAITNAVFAATGVRIRRLPVMPGDLKGA